ncbi:helix-turn-helix domain-containing protein [Nocardioides sp.]|uniref:helix-turn-helix domain-containing protein n=1 Tax=Nocardioides sp. TaxID=35761 RepID=UPI002717ECE6|nr:helix-turn-helix domain-containing protein [Nocardioides sp.]MDO9456241.1 helix-turn-helix domain-containing protein [Nocardioides sp.]
MSVVLNSDDMPVIDREAMIHEAICSGVLPVEIRWDRPADRIDLHCRLATAGPLNFNSARSSDNALWRTARQARSDHEPSVFVAVQGVGSSRISQGDRQTTLRPGDVTIYETTSPYSITNPGLTELHYFQVARSALALPQGTLDQVLGARIGPDNNPLASVVTPFLASLGRGDVLDRPRAAELVVAPALELVRALVAAHVEDEDLAREPLDQSLAFRIQRYVADHLGDRDLSAETIAAAHHVSVRQLYKVMAQADIRLADTIRRQRLEACRRELRDGRRRHVAIATVSARWGFADPSHFSRVFRTEYGMTPHEWRTGTS